MSHPLLFQYFTSFLCSILSARGEDPTVKYDKLCAIFELLDFPSPEESILSHGFNNIPADLLEGLLQLFQIDTVLLPPSEKHGHISKFSFLNFEFIISYCHVPPRMCHSDNFWLPCHVAVRLYKQWYFGYIQPPPPQSTSPPLFTSQDLVTSLKTQQSEFSSSSHVTCATPSLHTRFNELWCLEIEPELTSMPRLAPTVDVSLQTDPVVISPTSMCNFSVKHYTIHTAKELQASVQAVTMRSPHLTKCIFELRKAANTLEEMANRHTAYNTKVCLERRKFFKELPFALNSPHKHNRRRKKHRTPPILQVAVTLRKSVTEIINYVEH